MHSGPSTRGSYLQTLVLTDVASGWTECAPLLVRQQHLLTEVLKKVKAQLPFTLLGIDTSMHNAITTKAISLCIISLQVISICGPRTERPADSGELSTSPALHLIYWLVKS